MLHLIASLIAHRLRLLLCGRSLLLLRLNHLLSVSFPLRLLLLTLNLSLPANLLAHRLALRLLRGGVRRLIQWLIPQLAQLLSRIAIASRCLSRQIRDLLFTRLLRRDVGLGRRRRSCGSLI